jgi:hypothetical protein
MYIVILGGYNDANGILSNFTLKRLEKFNEVYKQNIEFNPKIILSGGFRFSEISHCKLIKNILLDKYPDIIIDKQFIENNNTIDEAINISEYLSKINILDKLIIITSNWHMPRVKYLFNETFRKISHIELIYIEAVDNDINNIINNDYISLIKDEEIKLTQLRTNPYGIWKDYLTK